MNASHPERIQILTDSQWNAKWKCEKIIQQLSPLETKIIFTANPFYIVFAFNLKLAAIFELITELQLHVHEYVIAHAILMQMLQRKSIVPVEAYVAECKTHNILNPPLNIHQIEVFGQNPLGGHPFQHVNIDQTAPGDLLVKLDKKNSLISCIREKKIMRNTLSKSNLGFHIQGNHSALFELIATYIAKDNKQ